MPKNTEHRDYGGSSGTGSKSNCQSQIPANFNADEGPQDNLSSGERTRDDE